MNKEHLDHPPTPEELVELYMRAEENDPRSLAYKRTLERPKVPVFQLLIYSLMVIGAGMAAYFGAMAVLESIAAAVLFLVAGACVMGLLLAKPILFALIKTYQALAPVRVRERCRFEPSCSVYMMMAVEKYGFFKGFKKGMKRWRSCKPPNGGHDYP